MPRETIGPEDYELLSNIVIPTFGGECAYCGAFPAVYLSDRRGKLMDNHLTLDHIVPLSAGGVWEDWNLAPACKRCNNSKGSLHLFEWWRRQSYWTPWLEARFRVRYRIALIAMGENSRKVSDAIAS